MVVERKKKGDEMKTEITIKIEGNKSIEFENEWNKRYPFPDKNAIYYGYFSYFVGSVIHREFEDFKKEYTSKYPASVNFIRIREEKIYSEADLKTYEILQCGDARHAVLSRNDFNHAYEVITECPICNRSICRQKNDLILNLAKAKKDFVTVDYEYSNSDVSVAFVVSKKLREILQNFCPSDVLFRNIYDKKENSYSCEFFQLIILNTYPPCKPPTEISFSTCCTHCKMPSAIYLGNPYTPNSIELFISRPASPLPAIGLSYEQFGQQEYLNDAAKVIIISQELYQVIRKNKIRCLDAIPAHLT